MKTLGCVLVLVLCVSAAQYPPQIRHFRRVDEHIYSGHQPNREGFLELKRMGIRTVLDLRGGWIHRPRERREVEGDGMHYISIRLSGIFAPKPRQVQAILAVLEDPARWPIFVHCRRGDDRVGLAIACYRMDHDHWSNREAYGEACHDGMSHFEIFMRRFIRHYHGPRQNSFAGRTPDTIGLNRWTSSSSISTAH